MLLMDYQGSSAASFGRSILSLRREPAQSLDAHDASKLELELELYQKNVTDQFTELSSANEDFLSLSWIQKLLDTFLCCQEEFRVILFNNRSLVNKAPSDRLIQEFFDRVIKGMDMCNAVCEGIDQIRGWNKLLGIVVLALNNERKVGEGQFRRAKKVLVDLSLSMLDDKDQNSNVAQRNRSFGRQSPSPKDQNRMNTHLRSLSWTVSRTWSASKQLQAIASGLVMPKAGGCAATNGIAVAVFTMNLILLFVMWVLVAAIPCQDRGLHVHFTFPKQLSWTAPLMSLHERVSEESKRRERRNAYGLLTEIHQMEKSTRALSELADSIQFPLSDEIEADVNTKLQDAVQVLETLNERLEPLKEQVRQVFRGMVRFRTEWMDCFERPDSR